VEAVAGLSPVIIFSVVELYAVVGIIDCFIVIGIITGELSLVLSAVLV